jgi:hypothetical protein
MDSIIYIYIYIFTIRILECQHFFDPLWVIFKECTLVICIKLSFYVNNYAKIRF